MIPQLEPVDSLHQRLAELSRRLEEAEETLRAIRAGEADALVVETTAGPRVFTLEGADYAHRVLLEAMNEGALTLAADGTILYANLRFAAMVGIPHERVLGTPFDALVHGPDQGIFRSLLEQGGDPHRRGDLALCGPRGTLVDCVLSLSRLRMDSTPGSWAVVVTDVTVERQRAQDDLAEQKNWFRGALSSIGDAVVATDPAGTVTFMNRVAAELTGWGTEGIGRPVSEVFRILREDDQAEAENPVSSVLAAGAVKGLGNHTILVARDGSMRPIDDSAAPIQDAGGNLLGVVLVFRDITERRRLEREREKHLAEVAEANESKDLFFNTLSHELRTPLAAMLNSTEVMKNPDATRAQRTRMLGLLEKNVRLQTRLIDDLLDLSRIMRRKVQVACEVLDLREVTRVQVEGVQGTVWKNRLALNVETPDEPVPVWADPLRLGQVISNLLSNAIKFTPAGGRIEVVVAREGGQAVLRVRDSGVGISAEKLPLIFEPFRQLGRSLTRTQGGLGIGLAIARSLAEMQQGTLSAWSEGPGTGSEFTLALPLRDDVVDSPAEPTTRAAGPALRVLIVEDSPDLAESLSAVLELMGHSVVPPAATGESGVEMVRRHKPDVALVDIGLPDFDGFEVARRLRADSSTSTTRLIALTGYASPEMREQSLAAGFDHYLTKPVEMEKLEHLLASLARTGGEER